VHARHVRQQSRYTVAVRDKKDGGVEFCPHEDADTEHPFKGLRHDEITKFTLPVALRREADMPRKKRHRESEHYAPIERFLRRRFGCFVTAQDRGTRFGRVDVIGLRDIGGELSGAFEIIAVEVKAGNQPFNTATGQAYGYSVYAERCYLADLRDGTEPFSLDEIDIASRLGVGLLAIRPSGRVADILASPRGAPLVRMRAKIIERLGYSQCVICGSAFQRGDAKQFFKHVSRDIAKAVKEEKGFVYWLHDIDARKRQGYFYTYERRCMCRNCVGNLFGKGSP